MTPSQVLAILLAFPPYSGDRSMTLDERREMLRPVAESIARKAGNNLRKAALLSTQSFEDTGLARYVIEGRCQDGPRGARCDDGRSYGPYQVAVRYCPDRDLDGQADCALRAAWGGVARCRDHALSPVHAWFVGLAGSGVPCNWPEADRRVRTYRMVLARFEQAQISP